MVGLAIDKGLATSFALMQKLRAFQLLGPVAVFTAFGAAEVAAWALYRWPEAIWLWRLNIVWFSAFRQSQYAFSGIFGVGCEQFGFVAAPLLLLGALGALARNRFLLGLASNCTLPLVAFVFAAAPPAADTFQASLAGAYLAPFRPSMLILALTSAFSLVSVAATYVSYAWVHRNRSALG